MTTAFVLSGGGSLGAVQVGMLLGLADAGITPDLIVGTSVGALNGAWIASRPDTAGVEGLATLWRSLTRETVFPTNFLQGFLGFIGVRRSLVSDSGLRKLLTRNLEFTNLRDAPVPLHVVATDVLSGADVLLSSGDAVDAVIASASIPAILPPVRVGTRVLVDGGVVNNTPISHAVALGATTVWVLPAGFACALTEPPRGVLAMALHALTLAINGRLAADIKRFETTVELRVAPPLCPVTVSPVDFAHAAELIDRAHESTRTWLGHSQKRTAQAALLAPHHDVI